MKKNTHIILFLCSTYFCTLVAYQQHVTTYIGPRSHSNNAARNLAGFAHRINTEIYDADPVKWSVIITPHITRSFHTDRINDCLFGNQCPDEKITFTVSGSRTPNRIPDEQWLADYFGLPTDFVSHISTAPRVKNKIVDVSIYIGLDKWVNGLYAKIDAPLVHTNWKLRLTENIIKPGENDHDPGYFNDTGVERDALLNSFCSFISGQQTPDIKNTIFQPLTHAIMNPCSLKKTRLAEIYATIGYQLCQSKNYYFDFAARLSIPAGNKPNGIFLFEPIVGNGHHWEFGLSASGYWQPWRNEITKEQVVLYAHANINHLFSTTQKRVFDLEKKPLSRYILAQKIAPPIENNLTGNGITPIAQFKREFAPVANFTALNINVHAGFQAEFALMFEYTKKNWSWLLGYNLWARSAETIKLCKKTPFDTQPNWALKGDTHVIGFEQNPDNTPIALSATQSQATIHFGKNFGTRGATTNAQIQAGRRNPKIDNPQPAFSDSENTSVAQQVTATPGGNSATDQINTSIQPIMLKTTDIDLKSAQTKGLSHSIFVHVQRTWRYKDPYVPFFGFGAQVEFGPTAEQMHSSQIPACINCALPNWSVWVKGGFSY